MLNEITMIVISHAVASAMSYLIILMSVVLLLQLVLTVGLGVVLVIGRKKR
jgi:hypothetical protein